LICSHLFTVCSREVRIELAITSLNNVSFVEKHFWPTLGALCKPNKLKR
jgi:hypothetical protein